MKIDVFYTSNAEDADKMESWKIVVRSISYLDRAHYYMLIQNGSEWFKEKTGGHPIDEDINDEFIPLRNLVYFQAEMLCAVSRETTSSGTKYLAEYKKGTGKYEKKFLPDEWVELDGMAEEMPTVFMDEWINATRKLNAGVLPSIPDFFQTTVLVTSSVSND